MEDNEIDTIFSDIVTQLRRAGCVFSEEEAQLLLETSQDEAQIMKMVQQRISGLPLEHVIGWTKFCDHRIAVDMGVFVPRKRTEFLASHAAKLAENGNIILDLCCGSGALGVAVSAPLDDYELHAADLDPKAVRCARKNVHAIGGKVYEGDLFEPLPTYLQGRINILIANIPYVPTHAIETLPAEAREHEARIALDGGADGLAILRRVAVAAPLWLAPDGYIFVETSEQQALQTAEIFMQNRFSPQILVCEDLEATIVIGRNMKTAK